LESLPFLSEEEKMRQKLTWGKDEGWSHPYVLQFSPEKSLYTYGEKTNESSFSWKQDEYLIIHNLESDQLKYQTVMGSKLYVIEDNLPKYNWKILNEIREVEGYFCLKAVTRDSIKNQTITAWFTNEIPISAGPEGYGGLPGMILMLEINDGTAIIEASNVNMDESISITEPAKLKGKRVSQEEYNDNMLRFFEQSIERERNPYWSVRY